MLRLPFRPFRFFPSSHRPASSLLLHPLAYRFPDKKTEQLQILPGMGVFHVRDETCICRFVHPNCLRTELGPSLHGFRERPLRCLCSSVCCAYTQVCIHVCWAYTQVCLYACCAYTQVCLYAGYAYTQGWAGQRMGDEESKTKQLLGRSFALYLPSAPRRHGWPFVLFCSLVVSRSSCDEQLVGLSFPPCSSF